MDDIDVEPVDRVDEADDDTAVEPAETDEELTVDEELADLPAGVDAPDYVLYGGKGGVGKTTMAAATGLASAAGGVRTLVVSTDPAHSLSDTYETEIPAEPARIREDVPLYAAEIDPDAAVDEGMFGADGDPLGGLGEMGDAMGGMGGEGPMGGAEGEDGEGLGGLLGGTMPGADEAAAMRQLLEYLDDPRFDRVVVDTAPTGHTLRLLQLPEIMDSMLGRVMKLRQRFSGMMDGIKGMFGGGGDDPDPSADLEELRERIERLRAVLRDPAKTDFRVVMIPEEMSVVESERLVARLDEFGIPVNTLVVNRVMEGVGDVTGGNGAGIDPDWVVEPNPDTCEFCARRWEVQQSALRQATDLFRARDVKRVPLLANEVRGEAALRVVAACLE
ncbi:TRC40/GET3/ArsA family transport-energizing ATPase [Halorubrum ezzemoulense]|uniref:TRC40/GET3/ArsA family transport-energizing ATPase n=1 Tax=Halorubrum ezzemoulense TaxID=337243 RepID=A0ABT4Z2J5_HALEZ|nr:TRC40/GET3/ArsA family transport-energizing ATPase [Halorubrum ezzemoulense]MDB2244807.1 TRC40/GET3/ArsA family transport-energizing ATPase [Halorubrum ezzemoulense]MDB2251014.1 TRC40/GET3/ArsA family transport-energizing ATPase [Halorubrum ezzemoulense]MDB2278436.1 TRC40/GET3/ArsA family transport-energizing ATPase [Halorubrum ezzemoulense]MDB2285110.1 TRC40/GET3/ArsA family transport-energizing ATPase [Halorubrum ezzemoulense]MDB2288141.1 TRC40/GET3/ArsA family transport-energizing ATPase